MRRARGRVGNEHEEHGEEHEDEHGDGDQDMAETQRKNYRHRIDALQRQLAEAQARLSVSGERQCGRGGDCRSKHIITGDYNTTMGDVDTLNVFNWSVFLLRKEGETDPKILLLTYLSRLIRQVGAVNLTGVDRNSVGDEKGSQLALAAIYTALDTVRTVQEPLSTESGFSIEIEDGRTVTAPQSKRQSALAFAAAEKYAALLGDPGSGKTTFVNFLALCLAGEMLGLEGANLDALGEEWNVGPLLPVRVVLRDFAVQMDDQGSVRERLWRFIQRQLGDTLAEFTPLLRKHLLEEGGLLILDGLDEVPEAGRRREAVKQAVLDFRASFTNVRILLTSRTYAYQRQEWRLPDFADAVLAPFNPEQIDTFVDRWYVHMAARRANLSETDAQGQAVLLKDALKRHQHLPRPRAPSAPVDVDGVAACLAQRRAAG